MNAPAVLERDDLLAQLAQLARDAGQGRGRAVLVAGEAGIGKTTLLRSFTRQIPEAARVLWGGCDPLVTPRPLGPLHEMADALDPAMAASLRESTGPDRLFPALLSSLSRGPGPVVVVFEDLHWADHATLDLIRYVGRRIGPTPILLVLSYRSDEVAPDHPLPQAIGDLPQSVVSRLRLAPLSPGAVAELARRAGRADAGLHAATQGNPFFVTEVLADPDPANAMPTSVRDAVWARLARLSGGEVAVLDIMSVMPGAAERDLLLRTLGSAALGAADACLAKGLLVEDEAGLRFRHELARQATLSRLPPEVQKATHGRIEAALCEARYASDPAALARRLHHAAGAGDGARVLMLAPEAARHAARLGAHQQAAEHLATALRFAQDAEIDARAQLLSDWAYEAGLAQRIDDAVIAARHQSIAHWRALGRTEQVGHNLRWLSRLHWYRGESDLAERFADEAVKELEAGPPGAELAMAYSVRSQLHMLNDRTDDAVDWGQRAIRLAEALNEVEIRVHALNNIGTALLFADRLGGREYLEASLELALAHGFHEHAARVYTNLAEWAVVFKDFALAERVIGDGLAFDARHDLDAWTYYLVGRQAQLRMEQGRLKDAETIAAGVVGMEQLTLVMRLPALTILGRSRVRLGAPDGVGVLARALAEASATSEAQRIVPVRLGLAEAAWLARDPEACREHLRAVAQFDVENLNPWERGELAVWCARTGMPAPSGIQAELLPRPRRQEMQGDAWGAAETWAGLGLPYEEALALTQVRDATSGAALSRAFLRFESLGARPAMALTRDRARDLGVEQQLPRRRRGPYGASRQHPLQLTGREQQILQFVVNGVGNREIAERLSRSARTIEHHVSSVLGKLGAANRMEAILRVHREPWLLPGDRPGSPEK